MTADRRLAADRVVLGLGALLALQVGIMFGSSSPTPSTEFQAVVPGASVRDVRMTASSGTALSVGGPALLLAFHSECAHCLRVSPQWSEWLRVHGAGRVLAISQEEPGVAERYALERGWNVAVASVQVADVRGVEAAMVSRTPWICVVDAEGIVQASGHGNRIDELGATFRDLAVLDAAAPFLARVHPETGEVFRFGDEGSGPSEMLWPVAIVPVGNGDQLFVWDPAARRVHRFGSDGRHLASSSLSRSWAGATRRDIRHVTHADPFRIRRDRNGFFTALYPSGVNRGRDLDLGRTTM